MAKPFKWNSKSRRFANSLGLTKAGYTAYKTGTPLALSERSPGGIARQAAKLTKQAYAPAHAEIDQQESRVRAIQQKREADNAAFAQWVASRSDQLRAEAVGQAAETRARLAQGQSEFSTQLQNIRDSANAQATNAHSGGVGGALGANLDANQAGAQAATLNASNAAQARVGAGMDATLATLANNPAVVAAKRAADFAESLKMLEGVADERQKLALSQAGDQAKAVQTMMQEEITKAQAAIAAGQFVTKETNDLADAAAGRATTRHGQNVTRQNAKDRLAAGQKKVNKYGYTEEQWQRFSPKHRQRIIKKGDTGKSGAKAGEKGSPQYKKAHSKAVSQFQSALAYAKGEVSPPVKNEGDSPSKPPKIGPNKLKPMIDWLVQQGFHPAVARMAVLKLVYPKLKVTKKTAPATFNAWSTYINSLVGSR